MPETNPSSDPVNSPAPNGGGSEEAKPLSALEAYRKDRAEMFAARLKEVKDREAMKEAIRTASQNSSLIVPTKDFPVTQEEEDEQLPATSTTPENELFLRRTESQTIPRPPERKLQKTLISALICIGLPVLIATLYYGFLASDQYAATAQFSIHSNTPPTASNGSAPSGLASMLAGGGSSSSMLAVLGEMFVVQDYVGSAQILTDIKPKLDLRTLYRRPEADFWARLPAKAPDKTLLTYWRSMVQVQVDNSTGIGQLTVKAFTAQDAKDIADEVLALSEGLVNKMSDRSQKDTIDLAQKEVDAASARVLKAHEALNAFFLQESKMRDVTGRPATEVLATRDRLNQELNFAEQAYGAALTTRQAASAVAMVRGLYLEAFVKPQLADFAEFPSRSECVLLTFLVASLVWVLGLLVVAATKEHL